MRVAEICNPDVVTIAPDLTVKEAARRMRDLGVGSLVVVAPDNEHEPIAIITDRDIVTRCVAADLDPDRTRITSMMSAPLRTVTSDTTIDEALKIMSYRSMRRLVVTDHEGRFTGVVALDDVLQLLSREVGNIAGLIRRESPAVTV